MTLDVIASETKSREQSVAGSNPVAQKTTGWGCVASSGVIASEAKQSRGNGILSHP
jgi:hydroxyethylthiazole kinase-like sugar kinase family protein